jgi:outer membrane protein assembly factor BamB
MKKLLIINVIFIFVCLFFQSFSQNVSQWRGPDRDGKYPETGLLKQWPETGPQLLWSTETLGEGYAAPVVTPDKLFVNGVVNGESHLFAFDLKGKLLWKSPNGKEFTGEGYSSNFPGARPSPTVVGDLVYTSSGLGRIACFEAATGKEKWAVDMVKDLKGYLNEFGYAESFVTDEKLLYCFPGGKVNNIAALDRLNRQNGVDIVKRMGDTTHFCSPILINLPSRKIYVSVSRHWLFARGLQKRRTPLEISRLHYKYDGDHVNTPVYEAPYLYWVSGDENSCKGAVKLELAADGKSVKEIWSNPQVRNSMGGLIVINGKLFVTTENKNLNHTRLRQPEKIAYKIKAPYGNLIYADSKFIVYGNNGDVSLFNYEKGILVSGGTFKITKGSKEHFAHPVLASGVLYIRHGGALMAYKVK